MEKQKSIYKKLIKFLPIFLFLIFTANYLRNNSTFFMPKEYKTIKKLVNQIASKNYLGNKEIIFSVSSGSYMSWTAKDLDLCKAEECWYYNNLNPYKKYKNVKGISINELGNQAYLYGGIEAYAWKGVVWLSRSTFRSYGEKIDYLACTIGHELAHIVFNDHINNSIKLSEKLKNLGIENNNSHNQEKEKNNKKEILEKELTRESEKKADFKGAKMIVNAGFAKNTCLKELKFLTQFEKLETETSRESTHPGYLERYESLEKSIENYEKDFYLKSFKSYKWRWQYNRKMNTLTFLPIK